MPCLPEDAGGRADEDKRAVALELTQEPARGQERRGQVRIERRAPPLERELPDGDVLRRPDAGDGRADIEAAGGEFVNGKDVVDGNMVSATGWTDLAEWSRAFMEVLERVAVPV